MPLGRRGADADGRGRGVVEPAFEGVDAEVDQLVHLVEVERGIRGGSVAGDEGGLDMRSRGTGERDERLGNDPAEQNTGEGSTTGEGATSQEEPQSNPNQ